MERGRKATRWALLKKRLIAACPPASSPLGIDSYYFNRRQETATEQNPQVFLLMFSCYDRMGLLHGNNITLLCSSVVAYHASICMESGFSLNLGILDLIVLWNLQVASITLHICFLCGTFYLYTCFARCNQVSEHSFVSR